MTRSDLHSAPALSLHSGVQQRSEFRCSSPGSHSSPCSTREFPHTLMFLCLKQNGALDLSRLTMERLLQLEKSWTHRDASVTVQESTREELRASHRGGAPCC